MRGAEQGRSVGIAATMSEATNEEGVEAPLIVDMRLRPTWLHPFFGSTPGTA